MALSAPVAYAYGTGTVSTTVLDLTDLTGLTAALVNQADRLRLTVNSNAVRYRYDGGDPTTSDGHLVPTNGEILLDHNTNIRALRLIRSGGSDAAVSVTLEQF